MEESLQHVPPNNHSAELTVLSSVITWPRKAYRDTGKSPS